MNKASLNPGLPYAHLDSLDLSEVEIQIPIHTMCIKWSCTQVPEDSINRLLSSPVWASGNR